VANGSALVGAEGLGMSEPVLSIEENRKGVVSVGVGADQRIQGGRVVEFENPQDMSESGHQMIRTPIKAGMRWSTEW